MSAVSTLNKSLSRAVDVVCVTVQVAFFAAAVLAIGFLATFTLGGAIYAMCGWRVPESTDFPGQLVVCGYGVMIPLPFIVMYSVAWCMDRYRAYRKSHRVEDWADEQN